MSIAGGVSVGKPWTTGDVKFKVDEDKVKSFLDSNCDINNFNPKTNMLELKFNALMGTSKHSAAKVNLKSGKLFDGKGQAVKDNFGNQVIISTDDINNILIKVGKEKGIIPKDYSRPTVDVDKEEVITSADFSDVFSLFPEDSAKKLISVIESLGIIEGKGAIQDKFADESYTKEAFIQELEQHGFIKFLDDNNKYNISTTEEITNNLFDVLVEAYHSGL